MDLDTFQIKNEIEIGKTVFLQPVTPPKRKIHIKSKSKPNGVPKISLEKRIAQDLYYARESHDQESNANIPVHLRLGGPERKRHGYKKYHFLNQNSVKPRIKKSADGYMTPEFRQRAQQKLKLIRKKQQMSIQKMYVTVKNGKNKYPSIYHSMKASLDPEVQMEIKVLMEDCIRDDYNTNDDVPLSSEDITSISLHDRFTGYP